VGIHNGFGNQPKEMKMKMKPGIALVTLLAGTAMLATGQSMAAAFYLSQVGTPMSIGTVGVANTVNTWGADAAWAQPAGMVDLKEDTVNVTGLTLLLPEMEFDSSIAGAGGGDGGNAGDPAIIPSHFTVKKLSDRTSVGIAITAPMGGAMDYGDNFAGRYGAQKIALQGLGISPSIGYKVNDQLSIGVGVSVIYTLFEEDVAINLPGPAADGKVKMEDLDDWGYQPFLGLTYAFSERLMLGVVYRAEMDVDLEGDIKFRGVPLPGGDVELSWDNPQWLEAALRFDLNNNYYVATNLGWQDWSKFSENELTVTPGVAVLDRDWKDTWRTGIAFGHFAGTRGWSFGLSYDSSPVTDKNRTIDLPMDEQLQAGASYFVEGKKLSYAIGTSVMYAGDAKVDQTAQGVRFKGEFDTNLVFSLGGTVRYTF
jgi:long-chain fatty acid transport protein